MDIKKSYLSVVWFVMWSWVLLYIPLIIRVLKIATRSYHYDKKNLHVEEGIFNKKALDITLVKIESVSSTANIFGNGTLTINTKMAGNNNSELLKLEFIANVKQQRKMLIDAVEQAKEDQGVKSVDMH